MNIVSVNCNAGFVYQARARVPNAAGQLAPPEEAGEVTGLKLRFTLTPNADAAGDPPPSIHADLDDLDATEAAEEIGLFEVSVSQALHQTHLRPLGRGKRYYGMWSKPGVADYLVDTFVVATGIDV